MKKIFLICSLLMVTLAVNAFADSGINVNQYHPSNSIFAKYYEGIRNYRNGMYNSSNARALPVFHGSRTKTCDRYRNFGCIKVSPRN